MANGVLAEALQLPCGIRIKNRFFKAALSEALGSADHRVTNQLVTLYKTWAQGGAGILVTGNVMIDGRALGEPNNIVVEDNSDLAGLQAWAAAGTENGAQLWMQINHPGKQSPKTLSSQPVAPSAVPLSGSLKRMFNPPRELMDKEIEDLIRRFGTTAAVAKQAGFTGVQIHAAHGYLISQFLSPLHNRRSDSWGGGLSNRSRFLMEVYQEVRRLVGGDFPVSIKLNSADFQRGGFAAAEAASVMQLADEAGVDLLEISGGSYENPIMMGIGVKDSTRRREAYFLDFAEQARQKISVPLALTGGFRSRESMDAAISSGAVDMIGLGKPLVLLPDLPNQLLAGKFETIRTPPIRTGLSWLDQMIGSVLELSWYEYQMDRIGTGRPPNLDYGSWPLLLQIIRRQGLAALGRRRP